jgi:two-component system chemotaxis response regulator CheB
MLNDGASGLWAIKRRGGTAIVQHPLDAQSQDMPLAALGAVDADEVVDSSRLAEVLVRTAAADAPPDLPPPTGLALEVLIAAGGRLGSDSLAKIADPAALTCPECHGVLSEVRGERPLRYRCQIGHAQTADVLAAQTGEVRQAVRVALRIMEERVTLVSRMAKDARASGRTAVAELYDARAEEYAGYAEVLRAAAVGAAMAGGDENPEG